MAGIWKRLDEKTKNARIAAEVVATVVAQPAVPIVQSTLAPPATPTEMRQQLAQDAEQDWAKHEEHRLREESSRPRPETPAREEREKQARRGEAGRRREHR